MKLDEMATYMKSDLADDGELVGILRECGLGHLVNLRQWFDGDVETGQASFMRTYLRLPHRDSGPQAGAMAASAPAARSLQQAA